MSMCVHEQLVCINFPLDSLLNVTKEHRKSPSEESICALICLLNYMLQVIAAQLPVTRTNSLIDQSSIQFFLCIVSVLDLFN